LRHPDGVEQIDRQAEVSKRRNKAIAPYGLPLLLPQPQPRRIAIGEFDAGLFQHALDRREIIVGRVSAALLEIDDGVFGNRGRGRRSV
jgi:hypothetical protein